MRRHRGNSEHQLDLLGTLAEVPARSWPDPLLLPHNEGGERVRAVVSADLDLTHDVLLVVGYASLDEVVRFLSDRAEGATVRILFGNEPFASRRGELRRPRERVADEVRDYWLKRGFSVLLSADIIRVRERIASGGVKARIASKGRAIHAKVYVAEDVAVTLGSSNFTMAGLGGQSELNARFLPDDQRFAQVVAFAEGLWSTGDDYLTDLLKLLDQLLRAVTWREAVARGCAEVLEGEWARKYVRPDEIGSLEPKLWPHQLQGISQAIWTLHNVGSVLVADATGSGKTRMGAWLLRAAYDRLTRAGHVQRVEQVVVSPPAIVDAWEAALHEPGLRWKVDSHGPLSNERAQGHRLLIDAIATTELLALDEAHNFLNASGRTRRVLSHYADNVVLFTATPINRGASDLLGMVELLGADNFPDSALETLKGLQRLRRKGVDRAPDADLGELRRQIGAFMVRRTRSELNRIAGDAEEQYRLPTGRVARYPRHEARFYELPVTDVDLEIAKRISELADQLKGVARLGKRLELPATLAFDGMTEEDYLNRVVRSVASLARHLVLDCLRSSRAALVEHVRGTEVAVERLAPGVDPALKHPTGNTLATIHGLAGKPPEWAFKNLPRHAAPAWVTAADAHAAACREDAALYEQISDLTETLSSDREDSKVELLARLVGQRGLVIAFDSHVLSLGLFQQRLREMDVPVQTFTGAQGKKGKRDAMEALGLNSTRERLVALCSDALSEGMNLQQAAVVVHLDTPTVIRTAEQRAGRVDRMNSPHDTVELYWPRDPRGFAPRRKDLLRERHLVVADLIGANLQMPSEDDAGVLDIEEIARQATVEKTDDPRDLYDAFRPVRDLIGPRGIVPEEVYDFMRTSQADVVAAISAVRSARPWGFFAVGGAERTAPRWVLLDGFEAEPIADLGRVADELRERLGVETVDHPLDHQVREVMTALLGQLRRKERMLLPVRRQRVLALADKLLERWQKNAWDAGDVARVTLIKHMTQALTDERSATEPCADLRGVADAWLRALRPIQKSFLAQRRGRKQLWRIDELLKTLTTEPLSTESLQRLCAEIPMIPPIDERVVAMVVGVPTPGHGTV